jgi:hypothetical protein
VHENSPKIARNESNDSAFAESLGEICNLPHREMQKSLSLMQSARKIRDFFSIHIGAFYVQVL